MIISHTHRYLFIEVPQTASSALATELVRKYEGRRILVKHADYAEFLRRSTAEERAFRVLATVRNPLDIVVSKFVKARDDHKRLYGASEMRSAPWGFRFRPEARERAFIAKQGADFEKFVRHFYGRVYNNRACLLPASACVLRYENLNDDFAGWLRSVGIEMVRPIPLKNQTTGRERAFADWYAGDLRRHALRVFGPYMRRWGYAFPADWPESEASRVTETWFNVDTIVRRFYMQKIHYGWVMPSANQRKKKATPD